MKRILIVTTLLVMSAVSAHADHMQFSWHDTIRPHGHKRSDAIFDADVSACDARVGAQEDTVSRAYKSCMRERGYRFQFGRMIRDPVDQEPDSDPIPIDNSTPPSPPPPDASLPPPAYEPPPTVDIHPFCPNPIC